MLRKLKIKLFSWEYWPTGVVYFPIKIYSIWLAAKAGTGTFFAIANPLIETGGLFGSSKKKQLDHLPPELKPITLFIKQNSSLAEIQSTLESNKFSYPFIAKPDRAERGVGVELIKDDAQLTSYFEKAHFDTIIQEYIDMKFEAGVFYTKLPGLERGNVPSLVLKDFLKITGNGVNTIEELVIADDRSFLVKDKVAKRLGSEFYNILPLNETKLMEPIGNHNRGTKFVNGNKYINQNLSKVFDQIANHIPEFYYGRFDLKAPSLDDLLEGKNIKIVEINGVNAEPAHIYDPSVSLIEGLCTLFRHWNLIYDISRANKKRGFKDVPLSEIMYYWRLRKPILKK
jgi:hypothetical protein